ncbi:amidohydrolase family protein, partial [candidate division KSB1 bacterium]
DGVITVVGEVDPDAEQVIDATGLYISPGFIDIHNHAFFSEDELDEPLDIEIDFDETRAVKNYLTQGVTTIVSGNCGGGSFKIKDMLNNMEDNGIGVNVIELVGHGSVRNKVMKMEDREPDEDELEEMKELVEKAMKEGAFGISSGLFYAPGSYAKTGEVIELAKVVADFGGIYATHIRDEGANGTIGLPASIREAIRIGEEAGVPIQISHIKAAGKEAWGQSKEVTEIIEDAIARGVKVYADQYPYMAGSTSLSPIVLPRWIQEGGRDKMVDRFDDKDLDRRIRRDIYDRIDRYGGPEAIVISSFEDKKEYEGKNLKEISALMELTPVDAAIDILRENDPGVIIFMMDEEDVETYMQKPYTLTCSDGSNVSYNKGLPHPRHYGAFTRKIRHYVLDKRLITMEHAIRAATGLPADMLGLDGRGLIKENYAADIVIFDPNTIRDRATYTNPHQYSQGIKYLFVNGQLVIENDVYNGTLAGKPLKKNEKDNR